MSGRERSARQGPHDAGEGSPGRAGHGGEPARDVDPAEPPARKRQRPKGGRPVGETLGGILAGFDQQVLRQQPPAQELVLKGSPVRGLSGDDPRDLEIVLQPRDVGQGTHGAAGDERRQEGGESREVGEDPRSGGP